MTPKRPDDIRSDELPAEEVKDICKEVTARNLGKLTKPSELAAKNEDAVRQYPDEPRRTNYDYVYSRAPYREDCERIVYSKASERMWGKTQMIPIPRRAHITTRGIHTERVSQTARSIACELGMNQDLAEAIGRGHDLGHPPLGHQGEVLLTKALLLAVSEDKELVKWLEQKRKNLLKLLGVFKHNIQGVNVADRIAQRHGFSQAGLNLTDQTRHGILSHDGEKDVYKIEPGLGTKGEAIQEDIERYRQAIIDASGSVDFKGNVDVYMKKVSEKVDGKKEKDGKREGGVTIAPVTMEGGIVALTDVMHYVGEDMEDLISLGVLQRNQIDPEVVQILGDNGSDIMHTLLSDLVIHSYGKDHLCYSEKVTDALQKLKNFLYKYYNKVNSWVEAEAKDPRIGRQAGNLQERMNFLFCRYLKALRNPDEYPNSSIVKGYLQDRNIHDYYQKMGLLYPINICQATVDYIAGFTDQFFFDESEKIEG